MFIEQPPELFRKLYPSALWRIHPEEKAVYLTFDDGPIPEVTPWVLDVLDKYQIKATFFMVGDNIHKHPDIYAEVIKRGHRVGNHTYNHIKGFTHGTLSYLENVSRAQGYMEQETKLFRPPHGIMMHLQYKLLQHLKYKIVMWDVVTRDYSNVLKGPQILSNVLRYTRSGSIITFHDSLKSWSTGNLQYALPKAIEFLLNEGYEFRLIE